MWYTFNLYFTSALFIFPPFSLLYIKKNMNNIFHRISDNYTHYTSFICHNIKIYSKKSKKKWVERMQARKGPLKKVMWFFGEYVLKKKFSLGCDGIFVMFNAIISICCLLLHYKKQNAALTTIYNTTFFIFTPQTTTSTTIFVFSSPSHNFIQLYGMNKSGVFLIMLIFGWIRIT